MIIIVGLGNPGKEYENTFHNMGFRVLDTLAEKMGKSIKKAECQALTCTFSRNSEKVVFAKPLTYMNLSGQAVKSLLAKYGTTPDDLVVIYDDIDIDRFAIRARVSGSAGTHNGMKSIVACLGTDKFKCIRVGIGRDGVYNLADYVLSQIKAEDNAEFNRIFDDIATHIEAYLKHGDFERLMREINKK
ncbi:MAG: aminoacyl-tRNA hydrolase [Clostridia bacterium]|nr:aminoacyl-tRNA hydrolase [Clostridia bacterium]